jgi:hypothetical protein
VAKTRAQAGRDEPIDPAPVPSDGSPDSLARDGELLGERRAAQIEERVQELRAASDDWLRARRERLQDPFPRLDRNGARIALQQEDDRRRFTRRRDLATSRLRELEAGLRAGDPDALAAEAEATDELARAERALASIDVAQEQLREANRHPDGWLAGNLDGAALVVLFERWPDRGTPARAVTPRDLAAPYLEVVGARRGERLIEDANRLRGWLRPDERHPDTLRRDVEWLEATRRQLGDPLGGVDRRGAAATLRIEEDRRLAELALRDHRQEAAALRAVLSRKALTTREAADHEARLGVVDVTLETVGPERLAELETEERQLREAGVHLDDTWDPESAARALALDTELASRRQRELAGELPPPDHQRQSPAQQLQTSAVETTAAELAGASVEL